MGFLAIGNFNAYTFLARGMPIKGTINKAFP